MSNDGPMDTDDSTTRQNEAEPTTDPPTETPPAKKRGPRPWAMLLILAACILTCALFMTRPWFNTSRDGNVVTIGCPPLSTGFLFDSYYSGTENEAAARKIYRENTKVDSFEAQVWIDHTCSDARESRLASIVMVWGFTLLITALIGRQNIFRWTNLIWAKQSSPMELSIFRMDGRRDCI